VVLYRRPSYCLQFLATRSGVSTDRRSSLPFRQTFTLQRYCCKPFCSNWSEISSRKPRKGRLLDLLTIDGEPEYASTARQGGKGSHLSAIPEYHTSWSTGLLDSVLSGQDSSCGWIQNYMELRFDHRGSR